MLHPGPLKCCVFTEQCAEQWPGPPFVLQQKNAIMANQCIFLLLNKYEHIFSVPGHSVQNLASTVPVDKHEVGLVGLDSALQEQERIITMSYTLASEASLKSKLVAGRSFISSEEILCVFRSRGCCWFINLCFEKGCKNHFSPPAERKHTRNCYICQNRHRHSSKFFSRHQIYVFWLEEG